MLETPSMFAHGQGANDSSHQSEATRIGGHAALQGRTDMENPMKVHLKFQVGENFSFSLSIAISASLLLTVIVLLV